jgi:threonine dehydratase
VRAVVTSASSEWVKESRNPRHRPTLSDFREASKRLNGVALHTPLLPLRRYKEPDTEIYLKPETLQPIGSYKIRGVYNWVAQLSPEERSHGISTLSAGNMAQAVGYVANIFNVPARVAIVNTAPKSKIEATKKYGAEVDLISGDALMDYLEHPPHDYHIIHPLCEYGLMDGYGTIGMEIVEDALEVDTIFVPVGSGFLASGISLAAKALKPGIKVIGVNAENCPHYFNFLQGGGLKVYDYKPSLADGIAGKYYLPNELYALVRETLDEVVVVSEDEIARAIRFLALENKLVTEGAGAISLAAALAMPKEERGKSVCILSGGSIDAEKLAHILEEK